MSEDSDGEDRRRTDNGRGRSFDDLAPGQRIAPAIALDVGRRQAGIDADQDLALEAAACTPNDIDLVIVATSTPDYIFPSTATLLQARLGMSNGAPAFDVQAVCAGFAFAIATAEKFIRSGSHKRALVVGAEVFSRILDWNDRGTCVLFGDGAGAVVLEASERPGILATALHADGAQNQILCVPGQISRGQVTGDPFLRMDGQAVFKFAVKVLSDVAKEVAELGGVPLDAVDWLIPHQANIRIIQATGKRLGVPPENILCLTYTKAAAGEMMATMGEEFGLWNETARI